MGRNRAGPKGGPYVLGLPLPMTLNRPRGLIPRDIDTKNTIWKIVGGISFFRNISWFFFENPWNLYQILVRIQGFGSANLRIWCGIRRDFMGFQKIPKILRKNEIPPTFFSNYIFSTCISRNQVTRANLGVVTPELLFQPCFDPLTQGCRCAH